MPEEDQKQDKDKVKKKGFVANPDMEDDIMKMLSFRKKKKDQQK